MTTVAAADVPPGSSTADLTCPLCGYSLRGLVAPQCPECGFAFSWAELLGARTDRHPYLFEHARRPRRQRRAFRLTWWRAGLRPARFWRDVSPTNPVRRRPLLAYGAWASAPGLLVAIVISLAAVVANGERNAIWRADFKPVPGRPGMVAFPPNGAITQAELDAEYPRPTMPVTFVRQQWQEYRWSDRGAVLSAALVAAAWPPLTAAGLLVFNRSLRRAGAARAHVLRTAVYGGTTSLLAIVVAAVLYGPVAFVGPWFQVVWMFPASLPFAPPAWCQSGGLDGTPFGGLFALSAYHGGPHGMLGVQGVPLLVLITLPLAAVTTLRTAFAYGRYLRVDRPLATAVAVQAMVAVAVVVATIVVTRHL